MKSQPFYGGNIIGKIWSVQVSDEWKSSILTGYKISDTLIDELVDNDVRFIMFIDPERGRYTSSIEDWLDNAVWDDGENHLLQSKMTHG